MARVRIGLQVGEQAEAVLVVGEVIAVDAADRTHVARRGVALDHRTGARPASDLETEEQVTDHDLHLDGRGGFQRAAEAVADIELDGYLGRAAPLAHADRGI